MTAQEADRHTPMLFLGAQRLRRLERDRERQSARWVNFENSVTAGTDSPERGLELALYYAVTHDESARANALEWVSSHPCERRQVALVKIWTQNLDPAIADHKCTSASGTDPIQQLRDAFLSAVADGGDLDALITSEWPRIEPRLSELVLGNPAELYALCELLMAVRATTRQDLREDDRAFFVELPKQLLLSLHPDQVETPAKKAHLAALALIAVDPNLEGSQFLQGWAIQDRQVIRSSPGIAEELLWADPYLPGVGYQNLDPWSYSDRGILIARTDWSLRSCWLQVTPGGVKQENCLSSLSDAPVNFGHLILTPMRQECVQLPRRKTNESVIIWKAKPGSALTEFHDKIPVPVKADPAGMLRVGANIEGKVCTPQQQ